MKKSKWPPTSEFRWVVDWHGDRVLYQKFDLNDYSGKYRWRPIIEVSWEQMQEMNSDSS